MEVILLERVARLGQMGDVVRVKDGLPAIFCCRSTRRCAPRLRTARVLIQ